MNVTDRNRFSRLRQSLSTFIDPISYFIFDNGVDYYGQTTDT